LDDLADARPFAPGIDTVREVTIGRRWASVIGRPRDREM
jgi:hypothetical protein